MLSERNRHALIWGDSNGNISILLLTNFADLLRGWRSLQKVEVQPTISISAVAVDPHATFIRWKTHDEWVAKVCGTL